MTNFNFLSNLVAENEVNRALAAAKMLQNAGGGTSRHKALIIAKQFSQYCVSRSEGAHTSEQFSRYCVSRSEGAQIKKEQAWYEKEQAERGATLRGCRFNNLGITYVSPRYSLGLTTAWKYVACILMLLVLSIGQAWGETYTWSFANGSGTISKTTTNFTSISGSKTLIYDGGDGCAFDGDSGNKYLKMGGKSSYSAETPSDRFFKFLAPSSSGTVSISYAGTVSNTEISAGSNGSLVWDVITPTANETSTSKIISGLTAGSTYVYISCPADKSYIKSITWTDAALPYERVYYSEMKTCVWETALESGASFTAHNSIGFNGKAGSGWNSYFSNYLTVSPSNGYATATFSPALSLTSNGVDKGRIRVYFSSTGDNRNISLEMNGNSAGSYNEAKQYRTYVAEYTIPDATENLSTLKMCQSGNSVIVIFAIEVLTYSSSTWYLPGSWYNNFERANAVKFTGSPLTLTLHLNEHTSYDFKLVKNNGSETWYDNSGGKVITTMRDWSIAGTSGGNNSVLFTGPEGDYTFTLDPGNQTLDIDYPNIHPDDNYMYFENTDVWGTVGAYIYSNDSWKVTSWEGTPSLANSTVEICGHTYHYCVTPRYSDGGTFENVIFRDLTTSGKSSDRSAKKESHGGKWSDNNSATIHEFNLYTISFAGNGNTGGSMSAIEGLCPGDDPELPANAFTRTGYTFAGWKTNVAITANSAAVAADGAVAAGATINDIATDITLTAQWTPIQYDVTLEKGSADAAPAGNSGSAKVLYDAAALTNITHATWTGHVLTGYYISNTGGTKVLNADGSFAASTVSGYITDNKWTRAENTTLKAQWTCIDFTPGRGGTPDGTYNVGEDGGTLTCSVAEAGSYTYQWKQYTSDQAVGDAVNAVGTGATTASFTPHPTVAGIYYYFCAVTNGCGTTKNCATSGTFTFNAAAPVTGDGCWDPANDDDDKLPKGEDASTKAKFDNNFTGVSGITSVTIANWSSSNTSGHCMGADESTPSGYMKVKNANTNKIITIVISSAKDITIGGANYNSNTGSFWLVESTNESNKLAECNTGATAKASNCEAGTYYIYANGSSSTINFSLLCIEDPVVPTASISASLLTPEYMPTGASGVQIGVEITGASTGWYYRVKNGSDGYEGPDNTAYTTTTWTMISTIGPGANTYVVELYDGTGTKQATSNTITVTGETTYPVTITAGANGTVSPSGIVQANGSHIKPEIRATPNSGYRFVNWTLSNNNATLADASSATTTIINATGACEITANFAAAATPILSWALATNSSSWTATPTNNDETNLTDVATSTEHAAIQSGKTSGKTCKISLSSSATPDKYVTFTFKVACGKKLTPSSVWMEVANVGGSSDGKMTHKAELSDIYGHTISATVVPASDGVLNELNITNGGGTYFQGEVTLKVWAWNSTSGGDGSAFRMGPNVKIFGEVGSQTTPAATITWDTHPANGQVGDPDATIAAHASDGSAVSFTTNDADVATIVDGKVHYVGAGSTTIKASITDQCGNTVNLNSNSFTVTAVASSYTVTYNGNDNTSGSVPTDATSYSAGDIVTVKGNTGSLVKTGQTFLGWNTNATASSGTFYPAGYKFEMPASNVTLYAVWGSAAEEKYYYGQVGITDGALVKGAANTLMFFTNEGGVIASSTALTMTTSNLGTGPSCYYNSNDLTHTGLNKSSNWGTSSGANKYIRGLKWANGKSYTLGLGTKVATSIMFYGWAGAADKTLTIGGVEYTSTGTSFFSNDFTKVGNFTDNVTIACGGDFYGILVITISTGAASNFTVSFNMNGHGSAIDAIANVPSDSKIGKPIPNPAAVDWEFGGWYKENTCTNEWNFASDVVNSDKTLYAKWTNCAPEVTTQPVAASYAQNASATALTVAASDNGGGELHYQWWVKENDLDEETGSAIPGETSTSFTPSTTLLGTTYYYCVVSNDCGNVFSNTAGITITDARPNPKANWDVDVPTHGGKGFNFSVEVNKDDDSNWDGTLDASMLTLSSNAVLDESSIVVDNTNKTISGTYGVLGSATSPVTFYLLLPATATQAATRLDYDKTFSTCTGGGDGSTYRVPVRKDSEKDASNNYRWVTAGAGEISYTYGSSISSGKATSSYNSFDSIVSSDKPNLYVRTYNANIKKVTLYVLTGGKDITVESIYKQTSYKGADDKDKLSTAAYSVTYDDGSDENTGAKGNHYIVITLEDPLEANDILMFKFSKNNVKAYGAEFTETADDGTETPTLGWSPSIDGNVEKNENAADFSITATRSNDEAIASLGTISYSSSNTAVATVNATTGQVTIADNIDFGSADHIDVTITATLSASGCYKKATTTYTLRVKKYVCSEAAGTIAVKSNDGCSKVLEITGYEAEATIQWYKDGVAIVGEIGTTYTATSGGTYYAITHKGCYAVSNELTISTAAATATKIVDEWYVKNGRRTPDIALVQTTNATSFTVTSGGSPIDNIGGCKFYLGEDGIIYLKGQQDDGSEPSGMTAGDETITITASACVAASGLDIIIHKQASTAKPEIAFVVDGTLRKNGGTATSVLAEKTTGRPIWEFLSDYYALTGCNAYWSVNSKELRQYYSQFDAILITDDPNTSTEGTGGVSYVKAFGTMVDVRPVLTMEAYVGKFKDGGWHVYNATPSSPNPRQVEMKLECKNHDIFVGLDPSTMDNVRTETINGDDYWFVTMVDTTQSPYHNTKDDYEALPALQGFDKTKFSNMLGVGTIKNDELQAGVERQEEPAARMMILGIQNNAMAALTTEGKMVVKNALDYLLKTDMEDVNDCANYFLGTTNDQWDVASNWSREEVPDFETRARILRPVVVPNNYSARVARVDIASDGPSKKLSGAECTGSLTIFELGALVVSGKVSRVQAPYYGVNDLMPTRVSDVAILSGTAGNGTLIMDDASGENKAYVQMYSKAVKGSPTTWQYIGIPHSDVGNAMDNYYDSWLYSWSPSAGWEVVPRGGAVTPWTGYCITYPTYGHKYEMEGTLVATADVDIDVPANSYQIIGNSWVAPIQIANFEDDDFGDITKTVYFFNTGSDTEGSGNVSENATGATRWAAGTYVAVPIHMAEYTGEKDQIIPSMQGFYVANNTGSAGTLHLDYDKLVRQHGVSNYIQGQMHAPRRIAKASNDPVMLKMIVRGSRYDDRLIVAEREDFTKGHDDGWDGAKWDGSTISPTIWSQNDEGGVESVTATPDMEGTIIGFRAGEDNEYTFHFEYDDMAEPLFLLDMDERMYVRILTGTTYTFTCADKGEHNRFLLTRKAPGIATGCEPIDGGGGPKAMKFIKDNKLYILLNGVLYDATGKIVVR